MDQLYPIDDDGQTTVVDVDEIDGKPELPPIKTAIGSVPTRLPAPGIGVRMFVAGLVVKKMVRAGGFVVAFDSVRSPEQATALDELIRVLVAADLFKLMRPPE